MRIGGAILLSILVILMGIQIGVFYRQKKDLEQNFAQIIEAAKRADDDYKKLEADYQYYQNPENLEKELRSRFNYHSPDEKLIIIVPKATTTSSTVQP